MCCVLLHASPTNPHATQTHTHNTDMKLSPLYHRNPPQHEQAIEAHYDYTPRRFVNGDLESAEGTNAVRIGLDVFVNAHDCGLTPIVHPTRPRRPLLFCALSRFFHCPFSTAPPHTCCPPICPPTSLPAPHHNEPTDAQGSCKVLSMGILHGLDVATLLKLFGACVLACPLVKRWKWTKLMNANAA